MPQRWFLNTDEKISFFMEHLRERIAKGESTCVEFVEQDRSTNQNNLFHTLVRLVAKQKGDETPDEIKRFVKLRFGVPILRAQDEHFRELYDKAVKHSLSYEEKLEAMDILPVTSRMTASQMTEMIDTVARYYTENGIDLSEMGRL